MRYSEVKNEIEKRGIPFIRMAKIAGLTGAGLRGAIANKTLRIDHLEKISKELGIPMVYWFQESDNIINDLNQPYGRELLKSLQGQVEEYKRTIDELRNDKRKLEIKNEDLEKKAGFSKASGYES